MANKPFLVPPERESEFRRRWKAGESSRSLSEAFGGSTATMKNTAHRLGLPTRVAGAQPQPLTRPQERRLVSKWKAGASIAALALESDLGKWVITRVLVAHGCDTNRMGYGSNKRGPKAANWKGGRTVAAGYSRIYLYPEDPLYCMCGKNGYASEHRVAMARHLGRPILSSESVHHIDGDPLNNAIENLQLRQGKHGKGVVMACLDCGSYNVGASQLVMPTAS